MEPKNSKEVYDLFVRIVRTCTGLNESDAKQSLALNGIHEPEQVIELAPVDSDKTPVAPEQ